MQSMAHNRKCQCIDLPLPWVWPLGVGKGAKKLCSCTTHCKQVDQQIGLGDSKMEKNRGNNNIPMGIITVIYQSGFE